MRLRDVAQVLLAVGAGGLLFYTVLTLYVRVTANARVVLLVTALVALVSGVALLLLSTSRNRLWRLALPAN